MINVLVVDDQVVVCEGLRTVLNARPNMAVVGVANNGLQALDILENLDVDLVLMDLKMPHMNGIEATRRIIERYPALPVLVLTTYDDDEWLFDAIRAGAAGYLLKDAPGTEIAAAIEGTIVGRTHIDAAVAHKLLHYVQHGAKPNPEIVATLTERELQVLKLLARGMTNSEISERLYLADGTVRNHVSNIFAKLNVSDRSQATALAWQHHLLDGKPD